MSNRYKGAVISATPPTTSGGPTGVASGAWTLEQQLQLQAAGLWPSQPPPNYIEDVFSTYLYTGNGSTQTITNNIDLSTKGGLVWIKSRTDTSGGATSHALVDTVRGSSKWLSSNATSAEATNANLVTGFTTSGFSVGNTAYFANENAIPYASWTFREQAKFFDVVTYTGNGAASRNIAHNLGSVPGCIINKTLSITENWGVYHRSTGANGLYLNATNSAGVTGVLTGHTSTTFEVGNGYGIDNSSGVTYVAYLFAHNAGGFGLTETDNVISCGSYTGTGALLDVSLGYEPQWVLFRASSTTANWRIYDNMRGWPAPSGQSAYALYPNLSNAEADQGDLIYPTSTGFQLSTSGTSNTSGVTYIYIAIRRGPMKVPTSGTSVFSPIVANNSTGTQNTTNFPVDLQWAKYTGGAIGTYDADRLRGVSTNSTTSGQHLVTSSTAAEVSSNATQFWNNTGFQTSSGWAGTPMVYENFQRAPSFFDVVCYTGTGVARTLTHNLAAVPEMMIVKNRTLTSNWTIYTATTGNGYAMNFDTAAPFADGGVVWNSTTPTSTVFSVGTNDRVNGISSNPVYVAYLFATCAGVSKVGSYTGTGTTLQIDCGFTAGSRFIMIKRTDSTGDWYVWDSARGIVAGNDPYFLLNSTAAEVTGTDYVDTYNAGFEISSTAPAGINASAGSYIFLAIA